MGTLPAHGLYARHVRNLSLTDLSFDTATPDVRPAIALEHVDGAVIGGLTSPKPRDAAIRADASSRNIAVGAVHVFAKEAQP